MTEKQSALKNNTIVKIGVIILFLVVVVGGIYILRPLIMKPSSTTVPVVPPEQQAVPTLSAQEIEKYKVVEDTNVDITAAGFTPSSITIKPFDQVFLINKDSKLHTLLDQNGIEIPIDTGKSFMISFEKAGTFTITNKDTGKTTVVLVAE